MPTACLGVLGDRTGTSWSTFDRVFIHNFQKERPNREGNSAPITAKERQTSEDARRDVQIRLASLKHTVVRGSGVAYLLGTSTYNDIYESDSAEERLLCIEEPLKSVSSVIDHRKGQLSEPHEPLYGGVIGF